MGTTIEAILVIVFLVGVGYIIGCVHTNEEHQRKTGSPWDGR